MTLEEWSERCNVAGFEDRGRGLWAKECRCPLEAGHGNEILPLQSQERNTALQHLILAQ